MLIDRKIVIGLGIGLSILATTAFADDQPSVLNGVVSGNIGAVTKYIYRGGELYRVCRRLFYLS